MTSSLIEPHDINKFPASEGLTLLPISMSRISNSQDAAACMKFIEHFGTKIAKRESVNAKVGAVFIYTDSLYFHSDVVSTELKGKFFPLINSHKNAFVKLLQSHPAFVHPAFSYITWSQLYLQYAKDFNSDLKKLRKIYDKDPLFQKYIKEDFDAMTVENKKFDDNQINFFLEEHLMAYLLAKGQIAIPNEFINGKEKWILIAYPGSPLRAQVYVHQKNFFNLKNPENKFEDSWYDLNNRKLYNFLTIDLEKKN